MPAWTMLTCEYPPVCGGVGDYSAQIASALAAAGDEVTVFTPPQATPPPPSSPGVTVVVLDDVYGKSSRETIDRWLIERNTVVLVQYVPTAFGLKGANVPWCRWLLERAQRPGADVRVMFHEPYFQFGWQPLHQTPLSIVQRFMARILLRVGTRTYLSTDSWRPYLRRYSRDGERRPFTTLPIPSTIPRSAHPAGVDECRRTMRASSKGLLLGHFGTYGTHVAPMLGPALVTLLDGRADLSAVCVGAGSTLFVDSLLSSAPRLRGRLHATGRVAPERAADVLTACDLMLQPFPDGVTTRRTSVMAALNNGRPVVTTSGHLTESVWTDTRAVSMAQAGDAGAFARAAGDLLSNDAERAALAARGAETYEARFALRHTIATLRA